MIHTDKHFIEESKVFFFKSWQSLEGDSLKDAESTALIFVKEHPGIFKYRDHVEAGVLLNCLVELGYIQFISQLDNQKSLVITREGMDFINR